MNSKFHEFINKQVKNDLKEFLPEECFKLEAGFSGNGKELSWKEKWGCMAAMYGNRICYESDCNTINLTPRQYVAAKVLYALGNLTDPEKTTTEAEEAIKDYLHFLSKQEKKPFKSLLQIGIEPHKEVKPINSNYEPHVAVGKLAVKAASEIESSTGRRTTAMEVLKKLQEWVDDGCHPDVLLKSNKADMSVTWLTGKTGTKNTLSEHVKKHLENEIENDSKQNLRKL